MPAFGYADGDASQRIAWLEEALHCLCDRSLETETVHQQRRMGLRVLGARPNTCARVTGYNPPR